MVKIAWIVCRDPGRRAASHRPMAGTSSAFATARGASALTHSEDSYCPQDVRYWAMVLGDRAMAQQVCVVLSAADREQLARVAADRNRPRKHVERARIVL